MDESLQPPNPAARAYELFAEGASVEQVARVLDVAATIASHWRTSYLIESGQAREISGDERRELMQARQRIAELKEQLHKCRSRIAELEAQIELALRANRVLRKWERDPRE